MSALAAAVLVAGVVLFVCGIVMLRVARRALDEARDVMDETVRLARHRMAHANEVLERARDLAQGKHI